LKISEFAQKYPEYAFDFSQSIREQRRIYEGAQLDRLPTELEADGPYHPGGRGRPNNNQTLAHSQCATCLRVLRNDFFYSPPSMIQRNIVFPHCRECNQQHNAQRYDTRAEIIRARRVVIWQYIAPCCAVCGFNEHISAMDMHHLDYKESQVADLITRITLAVDPGKVEALLREASKCVPLCSNCHRMVHAQAISLPAHLPSSNYNIAELLTRLKSL
jgi:hypothetical protein